MKRLNFSLFQVSLLACLLCALTLSLTSCGDNENASKPYEEKPEVVVPQDRKPVSVSDVLGTLSYNEELREWIIVPIYEQPNMFVQLGDDEGMYLIVSKMKKAYETYAGVISFSGTAKPKHNLLYKGGSVTHVYTVELSKIAPTEEQD